MKHHPSYAILKKGYQSFLESYYPEYQSLYEELAKGQSPKVCFISCCDSRVDPAILTGSGPGDLFVVRNVANLVPAFDESMKETSTAAALEYAIMHLKVEHVVILGHSQCGGIGALLTMEKSDQEQNVISDWVHIAESAKHVVQKNCGHMAHEAQCAALEEEAMKVSLKHLASYPHFLERIQQGKLHIHAWHVDIERGQVRVYDAQSERFQPLAS